jgi:hypothetical protein
MPLSFLPCPAYLIYVLITVTILSEHRLRVFENRVLRTTFGPKRAEIIGDRRKLHNKELHNLYSSPNIFRMIKSRTMRWVGNVVHLGSKRNAYRVWWESQKE